MWPCRSVCEAGTITDDLVPSNPVTFGHLVERNGSTTPLYLIGHIGNEPVYKTTSTRLGGKDKYFIVEIFINNAFFV